MSGRRREHGRGIVARATVRARPRCRSRRRPRRSTSAGGTASGWDRRNGRPRARGGQVPGSDAGRRARMCRRRAMYRGSGGRPRTTAPSPTGRSRPAQPRSLRTSMRSSRVSLRPATIQRSVSGTPASTSAWRTCHPVAVGDRVGQRAGEIGQPLSGLGEQVQHTDLGQHARRASRDRNRRARRAGGCGWRGRRRGRRRGGRRDRPTSRSGRVTDRRDPCGCGPRATGRARRDPRACGRPVRRAIDRRRSAAPARVDRTIRDHRRAVPAPRIGRCRVPCRVRDRSGGPFGDGFRGRAVGAPGAGTGPSGDGGRRDGFGHHAPHPHDQQCQGVLARQLAARARAAPGDVDVIDSRLVRLGPDPLHRPHTDRSSQPRSGHRCATTIDSRRAQRRRRRRHRRHLLDRPTPSRPHPHRRYDSRCPTTRSPTRRDASPSSRNPTVDFCVDVVARLAAPRARRADRRTAILIRWLAAPMGVPHVQIRTVVLASTGEGSGRRTIVARRRRSCTDSCTGVGGFRLGGVIPVVDIAAFRADETSDDGLAFVRRAHHGVSRDRVRAAHRTRRRRRARGTGPRGVAPVLRAPGARSARDRQHQHPLLPWLHPPRDGAHQRHQRLARPDRHRSRARAGRGRARRSGVDAVARAQPVARRRSPSCDRS